MEDAKEHRAATFMRQQMYTRTWVRWAAFVARMRSVRREVASRLLAIGQATLQRFMRAWRARASILRSVRIRCTQRMFSMLRASVSCWVRHVQLLQAMRMRESMIREVRVHRTKSRMLRLWFAMRKARAHRRAACARWSFRHWRSLIVHMKLMARRLCEAITLLSRGALSRALLSWRNYVRLACIYRLESVRKQRLQRSAIQRGDDMIRRRRFVLKRAAFEQWRASHETFVRLQLAVSFATHGSVRRALDTWMQHVERVRIHSGVTQYYRMSRQYACLNAWRGESEVAKAHRKRRMGVASRHHTRRSLRAVLSSWKAHCEVTLFRRNELVSLMFAVGTTVRANLVCWAWYRWGRAVELRQAATEKRVRALAHRRSTLIDFAWFSWTCYMRGLQVATTSAYSSDSHTISGGLVADHVSAGGSSSVSTKADAGIVSPQASHRSFVPMEGSLVKRFMDANKNIFETDGAVFQDKVEDFFLSPVQLEYDRVKVANLASLVGNSPSQRAYESVAFSSTSSPVPRTPASVASNRVR